MNSEPTLGQSSREVRDARTQPEWLKVVRTQVESLKFGTVLITVHDSKVVQIERVEKIRVDRLPSS
ncbi:MAG TPA: YezD family protein [Verrucomicrobiae bacterium]|nr:YezD family protein [Verrucomicrobiae bacterium]